MWSALLFNCSLMFCNQGKGREHREPASRFHPYIRVYLWEYGGCGGVCSSSCPCWICKFVPFPGGESHRVWLQTNYGLCLNWKAYQRCHISCYCSERNLIFSVSVWFGSVPLIYKHSVKFNNERWANVVPSHCLRLKFSFHCIWLFELCIEVDVNLYFVAKISNL